MFAPGTYDELRRKLVAQGVPDAQIKISHLNPKKDLREYLESKLLALPRSSFPPPASEIFSPSNSRLEFYRRLTVGKKFPSLGYNKSVVA